MRFVWAKRDLEMGAVNITACLRVPCSEVREIKTGLGWNWKREVHEHGEQKGEDKDARNGRAVHPALPVPVVYGSLRSASYKFGRQFRNMSI